MPAKSHNTYNVSGPPAPFQTAESQGICTSSPADGRGSRGPVGTANNRLHTVMLQTLWNVKCQHGAVRSYPPVSAWWRYAMKEKWESPLNTKTHHRTRLPLFWRYQMTQNLTYIHSEKESCRRVISLSQISTWQHTTPTREEYPCPKQCSNQRSQYSKTGNLNFRGLKM